MNIVDNTLEDLKILEVAYNYSQWIFSQFAKYTGQRIVEMGSGIGNLTKHLLDKELVLAIDNHASCVNTLKSKFSANSNIVTLSMDISNQNIVSLKKYLPDTIICVNVLEHIEDNVMTLKNMHDIMVEGGKLLLLVPALKLLYGEIDRFHNHYRRYSRVELIDKLNKSGFKIIDSYYMNSIGIFGWVYDTIIFSRQEHTSEHVKFFDRFIVPWLSRFERLKRPPIGLSLIVIAEKRL